MINYYYKDQNGKEIAAQPSILGGLLIATSPTGLRLPDDEIPALVGKLQAYMSWRAREMAKGNSGRR